jgi:hypothetical protein
MVGQLWSAYKHHNLLPYPGGMLDQPIWFLAHIAAIDLVYETRTHLQKPDADWNKLDDEAIRMIGWLDKDSND